MTKAVFITRREPAYDDLPEFRYHFPKTYLRAAEAAVSDWIVYYEPRAAGCRSRQKRRSAVTRRRSAGGEAVPEHGEPGEGSDLHSITRVDADRTRPARSSVRMRPSGAAAWRGIR